MGSDPVAIIRVAIGVAWMLAGLLAFTVVFWICFIIFMLAHKAYNAILSRTSGLRLYHR